MQHKKKRKLSWRTSRACFCNKPDSFNFIMPCQGQIWLAPKLSGNWFGSGWASVVPDRSLATNRCRARISLGKECEMLASAVACIPHGIAVNLLLRASSWPPTYSLHRNLLNHEETSSKSLSLKKSIGQSWPVSEVGLTQDWLRHRRSKSFSPEQTQKCILWVRGSDGTTLVCHSLLGLSLERVAKTEAMTKTAKIVK